MAIKKKQKTCRICKVKHTPTRAIQPTCNKYECLVTYAQGVANKAAIARKKKEARVHKEKLKSLDSLADVANDVQRFFNLYIRLRDSKAGYGCISCGTKKPNIQYCAGHFRTRKAAPHLRFNEDNVHLQCNKNCNSALSGNITNYRIELVKRIGVERVEALENNNELHRYTKEELSQIKIKYKEMIKTLKESN